MYKRHNVWDEDKWNIHSGSGSSGYAGNKSGSSDQQYHKNDTYGSSNKDENKSKDMYKSFEPKEEDKDKDKDKGVSQKEKTISDTVEEESKKKQNEQTERNKNQKEHFMPAKKAKGNSRIVNKCQMKNVWNDG